MNGLRITQLGSNVWFTTPYSKTHFESQLYDWSQICSLALEFSTKNFRRFTNTI